MSERPYMQLYIADYLGDTQHLSCEQHGAYLLLLMTMWRHGGELPNDEKKLARICRLSLGKWRRVADDVLAFFTVSEQKITQKRLEKELKKAREISAKRAESASSKSLNFKEPVSANDSTKGPAKEEQLRPKRAHVPLPLSEEVTNVTSIERPKGLRKITPDWKPKNETISKLLAEGHTRQRVDAAVCEMVDWGISNGKKKHDWDAALRNWVRRNAKPTARASLPDKQSKREAAKAETRMDLGHG